MSDPLHDLDSAARYLTLSRRTVQREVAAGRLAYHKIGGGRLIRFRQSDLDAYLDATRVARSA